MAKQRCHADRQMTRRIPQKLKSTIEAKVDDIGAILFWMVSRLHTGAVLSPRDCEVLAGMCHGSGSFRGSQTREAHRTSRRQNMPKIPGTWALAFALFDPAP
jgi:hypothetical protein